MTYEAKLNFSFKSIQVLKCMKIKKFYVWVNYIFKSLENVYYTINQHGGEMLVNMKTVKTTHFISLEICLWVLFTLFSTD